MKKDNRSFIRLFDLPINGHYLIKYKLTQFKRILNYSRNYIERKSFHICTENYVIERLPLLPELTIIASQSRLELILILEEKIIIVFLQKHSTNH